MANRQTRTTDAKGRIWRHPDDRAITLPYESAAALAVMAAGVSDYQVIADAVGMTRKEVRQLDNSQDQSVKRLVVNGLPEGQFFKLRERLRCPKCGAPIILVPCVSCSHGEAATEGSEPTLTSPAR